nr:immunoglobulin heavy chain junction region [Mus musculus]MBK4185224.1 immunoglobulin heavy chain junction region [Mus musculus]
CARTSYWDRYFDYW